VEVAAQEVRPQGFPEPKNISPLELALVPYQQHAKEEEEVSRVSGLEVEVERGIHQLDEMIKGEELSSHAGLVTEEVSFLVLSLVLNMLKEQKTYRYRCYTRYPQRSRNLVAFKDRWHFAESASPNEVQIVVESS